MDRIRNILFETLRGSTLINSRMWLKYFFELTCFTLILTETVTEELMMCDSCSCMDSYIFCIDILDLPLFSTYDGSEVTSLVIVNVKNGSLTTNGFAKFNEVSNLQLENNNIYIEPGAFSSLTKLIHVHMRNNSLDAITESTFRMNNNVKNLDLSKNQIKEVNNSVFSNMKRLVTLNLASNHIRVIESEAFAGLQVLRELDLSNNKLECLEAAALAPLRRLSVLRAGGNRVASLAPQLVALLAERPGLTAHLAPNPLHCACDARELRAAWEEATARGLRLNCICASGQTWDVALRVLRCEEGSDGRATEKRTTASTAKKALEPAVNMPIAGSPRGSARGDHSKAQSHSGLGNWNSENASLEFMVLLVLVILLAAITSCVVITLLVVHIRVKKAAKEYEKLRSNTSADGTRHVYATIK